MFLGRPVGVRHHIAVLCCPVLGNLTPTPLTWMVRGCSRRQRANLPRAEPRQEGVGLVVVAVENWRQVEQRSGRFCETIGLRQSPGQPSLGNDVGCGCYRLFALCHSQPLCWNPSDTCETLVLEWWGATTFGGLVGARSALAGARAGLGPNSLFSADRSQSRVSKK